MQPDLTTLAFVAQQTTNAVIVTDRAGRIEWVNDGFTRITGYSFEEALRRKPGDLLQGPATDRQAVERMARAIAEGREFAEELLNYAKGGRPYWISMHCSPIRDDDGAIHHYLSIQTDVTERRTQDESLSRSANSLRSIVSAMPLVVFATDRDGRFTLVEGLDLEKIGLRAGTSIGRSIFEVYPDSTVHDYVRRALAGHVLVTNLVVGEVVFETRFSPLRDARGEVTGCLGVALDVTEQMQATAELVRARDAAEAATRAKSAFLATMSHEIRTPLNAVIGTADLLLDIATSDEQRRYAETIRTSGDMLLAVIDDILDFSKIEAGNMELERRSFDLRATVGEVIDLLAPRAAAKGLRLAAAIDFGVPARLVGDPTRIRQILVNLVGNAVKFTNAGEVLTRAFCRPTEAGSMELELSVSDTGIGIPEDRLGRLFLPFSQVDASTTRRYGGSGLGLAISKRLCELMGGQIAVQSLAGSGSTFTVRLPVAPVEAAPEHERAGAAAQPAEQLTPLRILLAEDNEVNQQVALRMLERIGYSADLAGNGVEVLQALERRDYDVVLMDVQMPEMDGLEATRRLRAAPAGRRQPHIIAMTANAMVGDRDACLAAGMDDYISKPVQRESLAAALRRIPARPAAPAADQAPLDKSTLVRLRADLGPDFGEDLAALVDTYRRQLRSDIAALRLANADGDAERVALLAHRLRGASATLGALRAVQLCRSLELEHRSPEKAAALIDALLAAGEHAADTLAQIVAEELGRLS
jgi:PAS domain S-box-containing protein